MEKTLPTTAPTARATPAASNRRRALAFSFLSFAFALYVFAPSIAPWLESSGYVGPKHSVSQAPQCSQPPARPSWSSSSQSMEEAYEHLSSSAFRNTSISRLSNAVRIPTQSYDDLGAIGEDKRWDVMYEFAEYLETAFPAVHEHFKVEKVNTHGLVYTWQGSDSSLRPNLLMAHQDVVPVPSSTVDAWTHPPFDGVYDGKFIWGRGASDCKNQLIAILSTMTALLEGGFEPRRTILLSFGFDEEISGRQGAGHLAPFLLKRYGKDGIAAIVDEGATFEDAWGTTFAKPGVAEKGYTDVSIIVRMPGGHSSIPSDHTSIGVTSEIITAIESQSYSTFLDNQNPYLGQLHCGAEHSPNFPTKLKALLKARSLNPGGSSSSICARKPDLLALAAAEQGPATKYLMQTSQAVDVITGGVKVNALPERTEVIVNHRINIGETPQTVWDRLSNVVEPIAKKHNLSLHAFPEKAKESPQSVLLTATSPPLDVAPVTPTGEGSVYSLLSRVTRSLYGEAIVVAPGIMTGNTDTRYYWDLTRNIFRFGPGWDPEGDEGLGNIHTVDERVSVIGHVNGVKWFWGWVLSMDQAEEA
ncbi:hypothetical protein MBLNU230_g4705t1 [Neophaeotheca triangularis]